MGGARLRGRRRLLFTASAVFGVFGVSAVYGYLLHRDHVFPWRRLRTVYRALWVPRRWGHPTQLPARAGPKRTVSEAVEHLANIPYLRGYERAGSEGGVRIYDRAKAEDGLNFFTSSHAPVAILMDMDGRVVKTWTADAAKAFPRHVLNPEHWNHEKFLRDAELLPDGSVLAMFDEIGLLKLDSDSRFLWTWSGEVHHDLFLTDRGSIWTLLRDKRRIQEVHQNEPIWDDFALELSPEGKVIRRISVAECFERSSYAPFFSFAPPVREDVFHTNSVVELDGTLANASPAFRRGNLLVSIRNLNTIAVIDPDAGRVVWALSGKWRAQHSAQLLPTGHLLLFDNLGTLERDARVLELDPLTQSVLWSWGTGPQEHLKSERVGWVQRLPGGNTLITETRSGRALEVTPDRHVVWEFVNTNRIGKDNDLVAIVFFMNRVRRELPFLTDKLSTGSSTPASALLR